jgi:hypothetical protein
MTSTGTPTISAMSRRVSRRAATSASPQRGDSVELVRDCLGFGDCGAAEQIAQAQYLQGRAVQELISGSLATAHGHTPEY